ncbi:hypothetical protein ND864_18920 [Leptospira levettii]|nr:hypothetical protein [Leptospira levettii]
MKLDVDVTCANCKKKTKTKVEKLIPGKSMTCPHCNATIVFSGDDGRKIQKSMDDFLKKLKKK